MASEYSDLQPVPPPENEGLQLNTNAADNSQKILYSPYEEKSQVQYQAAAEGQRRCGLRRRTFWVVAVIVLAVIVAAVGGGVGGALSQKRSSTEPATDAAQANESSTSSSPTGLITASASLTASLTTTEVVGPSTTLLRDCPSSNNTVYNVTFGSAPMVFRKVCDRYIKSAMDDDLVNERTTDLDECINKCAAYNVDNKTQIAAGKSRVCNAVCWRNSFDPKNDWPGNCFGYETRNTSSGFDYADQSYTLCDGAAWINQSFD